MSDDLVAEGPTAKRFQIYYCDIDNKPFEREAEYVAVEEVQKHRFRLDRRYKIRASGKWTTRKEFDEWAAQQTAAKP